MDARIINRIIAALLNVLPEIGFKNVVRGKLFSKDQFIDGLGIAVNVELTSPPMGNIVFNMTEEVAKGLSKVMLKGAEVGKLDDLAQSAICEMINMVISDAVDSLNKGEINIQSASPVLSQCNSKIRVCNSHYIGFEMMVDEMVFEIGIGFN